jgi:hypothetical protein
VVTRHVLEKIGATSMHANPMSPWEGRLPSLRERVKRRVRGWAARYGRQLARRFALGLAYGAGTGVVTLFTFWMQSRM